MRRALLLAGAVLGLATGVRAQQVTARVGGELTAPAYTTFAIPITVDMRAAAGATLGSYTARLTWDPVLLSYNSYVSGGSQDSGAQGNFPPPAMNRDSSTHGILKFTAVSPSGVGGLVTIAQLQFYAGGSAAPAPLTLSFSEMSAAGTFANLLPMLTVQGGTFCLARGRWGDLDRDGASNSRDALMVLSRVVGLAVDTSQVDTTVADVDADGRTTSRDALVILSHAVGMPIAGHRVLLPVASSCGTGSARQVSLLPGAVELVANQDFKLMPQATDSAGRVVSLPPITWRSSDYAVAGVDAEGVVTPRLPGTVTITADLGPGVSASATITVLARRPNWYVDDAATGRPVQTGSAANPFESPFPAFRLASEGDTIRVATGTYVWPGNESGVNVERGFVLLGGTPGDTTTRPVFRGPDNQTAFWLRGGLRYEFRNIVFQAFNEVFDVDGARNLILEDVKFLEGRYGQDGIYMCGDVTLDTLRIERTQFLGNPQAQYHGDAIYIGGCVDPYDVKVLIVRDSRIEGMSDAFDGYGVDSLQVLRTIIRDNHGDGIYLSQEYNETPAVHIAQSRIERNRYASISIYDARRIVIDTSVIRSDSGYGLDLGHDNIARGHTYLRGDTIYLSTPYEDWLSTYATDSLVVQDVVVRLPDDTATTVYSDISADAAVVRRSRFLNPGSGTAFSFTGRSLLVDSVAMNGCAVAACDGAYGIRFTPVGVQPAARVLRSSFTQMYSAVYADGYASTADPVLEARNLTIDSIYDGIYASSMDSVHIAGNTITRAVYTPVQVWSGGPFTHGPSRIAGNNITCSAGSPYTPSGVVVYYHAAVVEHDTVTGCGRGFELSAPGLGSRIRQNTLRGNAIGVQLASTDPGVIIPVDSNGISGAATSAVSLSYAKVSLTHNRLENNGGDGLTVSGLMGYTVQVHDNAFVNNAQYAVNSQYGDPVDASANWWGSPSAPPINSTPNGVIGTVDTSNPLASEPTNLPGLAPPVFRLGILGTQTAGLRDSQPPMARSRPPLPDRAAIDAERARDREAERQAKAARRTERRTGTTP